MTSEQCDKLLDLFMLCKLAKNVWLDQAPINQQQGSSFKEIEEVKTLADELATHGVPDHKIIHVLSTHLPPALFRRHFPQVATA